MELSVARPVTAAAVEVQVTQEFDERLEILQALDVGYLTTFAHGNPSPAKAVDSAVEPTSLNSGRKFRAEQAWSGSIRAVQHPASTWSFGLTKMKFNDFIDWRF
jgi:hypothetical protein